MISFKEWLQLKEVSTDTGDIAGYSRRWGPGGEDDIVRRQWPNDDDEHKKRKKHKKPHKHD